jgi:hypothetical protein
MTLDEIKDAVRAGQRVCWSNRGYEVHEDSIGQWLITYRRGTPHADSIGLTWMDGVTVNGRPEEFFIDDMPHGPLSPY